MPTIKARRRHNRVAQPLTRPNVLWVITDDQEQGTLVPEVMPYLASNPAGSWVDFPKAVETTPLCGIIRTTFFTGQRWQRHGVKTNDDANLMDESQTIAVRLSAAGYRTGLLGKYQNDWPITFHTPGGYVAPGWEVWHARTDVQANYFNWTAYTNIPGAKTTFGSTAADYQTDVLADLTENYIRGADSRPWFLMVTPAAPHENTVPAPRHASLTFPSITDTNGNIIDPPDFNPASVSTYPGHVANRPQMTQAQVDAVHTNRIESRKCLRSVDDLMQRAMTALIETGQLENTVVIFCTDNASMMGRKRWSVENAPGGFEKKVPYQGSVDALLKIRYPGAVNRVENAPVATVDLPCSIVKWANGTWGGRVTDGSTKLADVILNTPNVVKRPAAESTYPEADGIPTWHSIITDDNLKYVEYRYGSNKGTVPGNVGFRELFDLTTDPWEMTNLYGQNTARDSALSARLAQHVANPLFWEG